jgi:hypothetical protein
MDDDTQIGTRGVVVSEIPGDGDDGEDGPTMETM